jgi:hypothetical protein
MAVVRTFSRIKACDHGVHVWKDGLWSEVKSIDPKTAKIASVVAMTLLAVRSTQDKLVSSDIDLG